MQIILEASQKQMIVILSETCHIKATCSSVSCCFNVDKIRQSFEASIQIDPCTFSLTITIEKLTLFEFVDWIILLVVKYCVYNLTIFDQIYFNL
jgi:hypothetical protein